MRKAVIDALVKAGHAAAADRLKLRRIGKEAVVKMIDEAAGEPVTFSCYPRNSRYIPELMEKMEMMILNFVREGK